MTTRGSGRWSDTGIPLAWYVGVVRRHLLLLLVLMVGGGAIGMLAVNSRPPSWTAYATVLVGNTPAALGDLAGNDTDLLAPTLDTEAQLVGSGRVMRPVARALGRGTSTQQARQATKITAAEHSRIMRIAVTGPTAPAAAKAVRAAAVGYLQARDDVIQQQRKQAVEQLQLQIKSLTAQINQLPPRGQPLRPLDPNQRRRALVTAIGVLQDRLTALPTGTVPGQLLSLTAAVDGRRSNLRVPLMSGAVTGLLLGLIIAGALEARQGRPRTNRPSTRTVERARSLTLLRAMLTRTTAGPVTCVESVGRVRGAEAFARDLAGHLSAAGAAASFVHEPTARILDHDPAAPDDADASLRHQVLAAWFAEPDTERVVVSVTDPLTTEELITWPGVERLTTDVVLLLPRHARPSDVDARIERLHRLGARVHLVVLLRRSSVLGLRMDTSMSEPVRVGATR